METLAHSNTKRGSNFSVSIVERPGSMQLLTTSFATMACGLDEASRAFKQIQTTVVRQPQNTNSAEMVLTISARFLQ